MNGKNKMSRFDGGDGQNSNKKLAAVFNPYFTFISQIVIADIFEKQLWQKR